MRVLTLGTFDMLHPGHLGLFGWCRRIADGIDTGLLADRWVMAAVNSDRFVTQFKTAPRYHHDERMKMVGALKSVDSVHLNDGTNQARLIEELRPEILVIGSDWARKDYLAQLQIDQDWLDEHSIALAYVPRTGDWSSTEMRGRGVPAGAFTGKVST